MINKLKFYQSKSNRGQIAIIVLLASAVLLTIGLSASRKSIIDTKIDTDEELLKEAFNAAESGINNYLNTGSRNYSDSAGQNSASIEVNTIGGEGNTLQSESQTLANTNQFFWLVDHLDDGQIGTSYYSTSNPTIRIKIDSSFNGGVKIDYFYKSGASYLSTRVGYYFNSGNPVGTGFQLKNHDFDFTLTGQSLLLVITPVASPLASITLSGTTPFPVQGEEITAVGTAGEGVKTQIKTRNVYQVPPFFLESITAKNIVE